MTLFDVQDEPLQKSNDQPSLFGGSVVDFGPNKKSGSLFQSEPKLSTPALQSAGNKDNEGTTSGELVFGAAKTEAATATATAAAADDDGGGNSPAPKTLGLFSSGAVSSTSAGTPSIFGSTFGSQKFPEKSAEPKVPDASSVPKFLSATAEASVVINGKSTPSSEPAVALKQPSEAAATTAAAAVPQSGLFGFPNPGT